MKTEEHHHIFVIITIFKKAVNDKNIERAFIYIKEEKKINF
jgi:hypothetical protein